MGCKQVKIRRNMWAARKEACVGKSTKVGVAYILAKMGRKEVKAAEIEVV